MVLSQHHVARYVLMVKNKVDVVKLQRDLDMRFPLHRKINDHTIGVLEVDCDHDVLAVRSSSIAVDHVKPNSTGFPMRAYRDYIASLLQTTKTTDATKTDATICVWDSTENSDVFVQVSRETLEQQFIQQLAEYQQRTSFRFSFGQQEWINRVLSHPDMQHNVIHHFWMETIECY